MGRSVTNQNAVSVAIRHLASERSPACLLDTSGSFLFVNDAWDRQTATATSGAAVIGTPWLDHIRGEEARRVRAEALDRALRGRGGVRRITFVEEANTPTLATLVSTRLVPVLAHGAEPVGVAVVHTVVRERPVEEVYDVVDRPAEAYRGADGRVARCSCCLRVRDPATEHWDFVPALVSGGGAFEHVLCGLCAELHLHT